MLTRNRELWLATLAILLITLLYVGVVTRLETIPAASGFFGHALGVIGFLLMLMTETLYSLRKRSRTSRWGRMANWLQFHIFTGLVGPFLVLLHTSWKFNGLAGIVLWMTLVIVVSGFIGRYIYTAVPRTADETALQVGELADQILQIETIIHDWSTSQPRAAQALIRHAKESQLATGAGPMLVFGRLISDFSYLINWWREYWRMDKDLRTQALQLAQLVHRRRVLQRQMASLAIARRLLATWHAVHIPIGMALFTAALVHIGAVIYFAASIH